MGKKSRCPFVEERCVVRTDPYNCPADPSGSEAEDCTWDGRLKGICNIYAYTTDLPQWYQYYSDPTWGGNDDLADYCGFYSYQESYQGDCTVTAYNTRTVNEYQIPNYGEHYCPSCRCMSGVYTTQKNNTQQVGPSCFNFTCVNNQLKVRVGYVWYDCTSDGQHITPTSGFDGYFICPTPANKWCPEVPSYTTWPVFLSVSPTSGSLGGSVTVEVSGIDPSTVYQVLFGDYYGCSEPTMNAALSNGVLTINCEIGEREDAPVLRGNMKVDVTVTDIYGRGASSVAAFTMSEGHRLISQSSFALVMFFLLLLV